MGRDDQGHLDKVVESLEQIAQSSSQLQITHNATGSMVVQQFREIRSDEKQICLVGSPGEELILNLRSSNTLFTGMCFTRTTASGDLPAPLWT